MAETFLENVKLKIGTETQFQEKLKDLPIGTLVGTTDPIDEGDLSTDVINKLAAGANALPKPTNDTTGSAGQVLKKTASGSEWSDENTQASSLVNENNVGDKVTISDGVITLTNDNAEKTIFYATKMQAAGRSGELQYSDIATNDGIATVARAKQDKLVDGSNIKTINGNSILGEGDLVISGGGSGDVTAAGNNNFTGVNSFNNMLYANGGLDTYKIENLNTIITNSTTQGTLTIPKNVTGTFALTSDITTATSGMVKETTSGITINNGQVAYKKAFAVSYIDPELGDYTGISYGIDRVVRSTPTSSYTYTFPTDEGEIAVKNSGGDIVGVGLSQAGSISQINGATIFTYGIDLNNSADTMTLHLATDKIHTNNVDLTFPTKAGTFALTSDVTSALSDYAKLDGNPTFTGFVTFQSQPVLVSNEILRGSYTYTLPDKIGTFAMTSDITTALSGYAKTSDIPTVSALGKSGNLSDGTQDSTHRLVTDTEKSTWNGKQNALVSGTNIKTINGQDITGPGNITISGGTSPIASATMNGTTLEITLA